MDMALQIYIKNKTIYSDFCIFSIKNFSFLQNRLSV